MKRVYRSLIFLSLSGLLCLFFALPANAQHRGGGGGGGHFGGGGGHFSGGGGAHFNGGGTHFNGGAHFNGTNRSNAGAFRGTYSTGRSYSSAPRGGFAGRSYGGNAIGVHGRSYGGHGYVGRGYAGHGYIGRGYGRGYAGFGYHGYFGRGGFYNHRGFYNSLYYPRLGFRVGFLPYGYYSFYWDGLPYYYSNGYYYEYNDDQYTVVEPPVGAEISTLPSNAQSIVINGQQYYELDGVYYVAITKDDGSLAYEIAGKDGELNTDGGDQGNVVPPAANDQDYNDPNQSAAPQDEQTAPPRNGSADLQIGDIVQSLPVDSRGVTVNGQRLFVSPDDVYYQKTRDNNNHVAYKIVGLPSKDPNN